MSGKSRFWRNVALIGVAHAVVITGLVRWNAASKQPNDNSIVWVDASQSDGSSSAAAGRRATPSAKPLSSKVEPIPKPVEPVEQESTILASAKSEIELPAPTSTPTPIVKPSPTPTYKVPPKTTPHPPRKPRPKPTPRPTPKPTPKPKTLLTKVFPHPSPKVQPTPEPDADKDNEPSDDETTEKDPATEKQSVEQASSTGKVAAKGDGKAAGTGSGATKSSEFATYGRMLHDRFYSEWSQPTTTIASAAKMSTVVRVRIEKDGRVSNFEIIRPSGNVVVDESIAEIGKRVNHVDPLPAGLRTHGHYDVKINFELNSD